MCPYLELHLYSEATWSIQPYAGQQTACPGIEPRGHIKGTRPLDKSHIDQKKVIRYLAVHDIKQRLDLGCWPGRWTSSSK